VSQWGSTSDRHRWPLESAPWPIEETRLDYLTPLLLRVPLGQADELRRLERKGPIRREPEARRRAGSE
jgi:hypothetical protein